MARVSTVVLCDCKMVFGSLRLILPFSDFFHFLLNKFWRFYRKLFDTPSLYYIYYIFTTHFSCLSVVS